MGNSFVQKIQNIGGLVKFSHTIFALPFALASMLVAAQGLPPVRLIFLILLAMVTARSAAMAFNRFLDADIDAKNPRTSSRHIPQKILSSGFVLVFSLANAALFIAVTWFINPICFQLSFVAIGVLFFYSWTKRFTSLSHLFLGLALGISPIGAWLAVRGSFDLIPLVLSATVLLWVAGFDIIYATQDYQFDQKEKLHSLVVRVGISKALYLARAFHVLALVGFFVFGEIASLKWPYFLSFLLVTALLVYEHALVKPDDLSKVDAAFFNVNGFISLVFLAGVILSLPSS